jgi:Zn ribbon nucleic-acid-binding protein
MKTKYISLTTAIGLWEEYKIDYVRKLVECDFNSWQKDKAIEIAHHGNSETEKDPTSEIDVYKTASLFYHIYLEKIKLYGKKKQTPPFINPNIPLLQIDESVLLLEYRDDNNFVQYQFKFEHNYDYTTGYNPSVNYDVLKYVFTGDIRYTDLSIEYEELNNYIKVLFAD